MMNFWTPTFSGWGDGRNDSTMPWYTEYDYVEVYSYNWGTKGFDFAWRDDFNNSWIDTSRWYVSDGWGFESNSCTFFKSQVY